MKRVLLATTALVAAGAFVGTAAQAQDMMVPMTVGVGGYYTIAAIGYSGDDEPNHRSHGINQNMEMQFRAEGTLDNGITAGVRARFTANDYEHSDEQEVYFSGAFGSFHAGAIEGAAQQMTVWAPGASVPIGGIKSPWFQGIGGMWTTGAIMDEDALKVVFFSPVFNGISLGLSYAPENSTNAYAGRANNDSVGAMIGHDDDASDDHLKPPNHTRLDTLHTKSPPGASQNSEQITASLSYSVDVMGGSLSANIGYETYSNEGGGDDPTAMRYGATISVDQVAIGAAVHQQDLGGSENTYSDVGIGWTQGPLMLGVQYGVTDVGGKESNIVAFNTNYNLGPGIDVGLQLGAGEKAGETGQDQFTQFLLGTMFNF